jgi:hypothetical protein
MLRQSLIAAACALVSAASTLPAGEPTLAPLSTVRSRTVSTLMTRTYDPVPNASYSPNYRPTYPTAYVTATLVTSLPGAAVCRFLANLMASEIIL